MICLTGEGRESTSRRESYAKKGLEAKWGPDWRGRRAQMVWGSGPEAG